ncbi:MAG: hypothetical protein ACK5WY_04635 [Holosporaceae bacterium]|jgi:hypothetical protein|nr:hypothetical protein [Rhodospirillaceae bacterium]
MTETFHTSTDPKMVFMLAKTDIAIEGWHIEQGTRFYVDAEGARILISYDLASEADPNEEPAQKDSKSAKKPKDSE